MKAKHAAQIREGIRIARAGRMPLVGAVPDLTLDAWNREAKALPRRELRRNLNRMIAESQAKEARLKAERERLRKRVQDQRVDMMFEQIITRSFGGMG